MARLPRSFWAQRRLLAVPDALPQDLRSRFKTLCDRLPDPLPAAPPTSLLHGNLRAANVLFRGSYAYLIDPGCY
ncbi:phosphotransferase [Leisingera sp. HS039]|uniref:phosphotransferase n=1 Tax=Leisingera sp. HS039 TaxID=2818496 RepID=UPI0032B4CE77